MNWVRLCLHVVRLSMDIRMFGTCGVRRRFFLFLRHLP